MKTITKFPKATQLLDPVFIPISDGVKLAAKIWLPVDAENNPVPAILEYLPYRRTDGTAARDETTHPYFAGNGYACLRVDMRGSGDSEGIMRGEYLMQEQDDALEVLEWIASQSWCNGNIGMMGISWGGFNGLQIAARNPAPLKAIVSICSTDDRYSDDIHYMGGCMLMDNPAWHSYMFSLNTTPPDPNVVGNRWFEIWMDRLQGSGFWLEEWVRHQTRDDFWKHGSVCENFGDIKAAVYAVGGWADGYSNAVFRLLSGLQSPCKGLVGPWAHKYPHFAKPGPAIGFLHECLRWWDYWLRGIDNGIMSEPKLRVWIQDPEHPSPYYEHRPGKWACEFDWPTNNIKYRIMHLNCHGLDDHAGSCRPVTICSPSNTGMMSGHWCAYGLDPDLPSDQRAEAGGSLVFDTEPLLEDIVILGAPILKLKLSSDSPVGMVAAVLSEILPDGAATRVSYGLLNLTHHDSHENPAPLEPGMTYDIRLQLNDCGHNFASGNRIRIALSTAYWPTAWPGPNKATLTISTGVSTLGLPVRGENPDDARLVPFKKPEGATPINAEMLSPASFESTYTHDAVTGITTHRQFIDEGTTRFMEHDGLCVASTHEEFYRIHPDDPLGAELDIVWTENFQRGDWNVSTRTRTIMRATSTHYILHGELSAYHGDELVHNQIFDHEIERDLS